MQRTMFCWSITTCASPQTIREPMRWRKRSSKGRDGEGDRTHVMWAWKDQVWGQVETVGTGRRADDVCDVEEKGPSLGKDAGGDSEDGARRWGRADDVCVWARSTKTSMHEHTTRKSATMCVRLKITKKKKTKYKFKKWLGYQLISVTVFNPVKSEPRLFKEIICL